MKELRSFTKYLVDSGAITHDALADAFVEQLHGLPTVLAIVRQLNLLPAKDLIEIALRQSEKEIDFISAARELGYWTEELRAQVWEQIRKHRTSLVQILANRGVSLELLNTSLDTYLTTAREAVAMPPAIAEFGEQFNRAAWESLSSDLGRLPDEGARAACVEKFHRFQGAAIFASLPETQRLFASLEAALAARSDLEVLKELGKDELVALWRLREHVVTTGSESGFSETDPKANQLLELCTRAIDSRTRAPEVL